MAQKALCEYDAKRILAKNLKNFYDGPVVEFRGVQVTAASFESGSDDHINSLVGKHPWLATEKLVVKPDQLIKRRGKGGLLLLNATWDEARAWMAERVGKEIQVEHATGVLTTFFVEPFLRHEQAEEHYVCIQSTRDGEEILFHHEGGVDVGDVDAKALRLMVPTLEELNAECVESELLREVTDESRRGLLRDFVAGLFRTYRALHFCYLEINPLVVTAGHAVVLDVAAKLDETAEYVCGPQWGEVRFPAPFGRKSLPEEAYIRELDSKTGASLKLTILNPEGRVWTMVAGGGASVVYADTICDLGFGHELANYGEYSGAPTETMTYEYARTILDLMTRGPVREEGKILIVGGGIANFTDVAQTFKGIIRALKHSQTKLQKHRVKVWVRRGGPNFQEGLQLMRQVGRTIGVPVRVYGPETEIVAIVPMALGLREAAAELRRASSVDDGADGDDEAGAAGESKAGEGEVAVPVVDDSEELAPGASGAGSAVSKELTTTATVAEHRPSPDDPLFTPQTRCVVYGMQLRAVQGMLDFDFMCKRTAPSVAAIIFPFTGNHFQKFYWGQDEVLIPVYQKLEEATTKHPEVDVMVNFASFRSVLPSTLEALETRRFRTIALIAEGVPEQFTRQLIEKAKAQGVTIIGPATVGGIKPGSFRIGNTGGMLDNIIASKLYRPGSVAYVSRSGGMSNELNSIIAARTDGVCEGVAIGGDRYPGSRFVDHLLRYQADPRVKAMVLLGEVGGTDEYDVCEALRDGRITKPIVAWCIGTCAKMFPYDVQFGHAGALANAKSETADAKNTALREAGAVVPPSFDQFGTAIEEVYQRLVASGDVVPRPEPPPPRVPMDFTWAQKLGLIRKPANFVSTICDDRGEELLYAGMPISKVFEEDIGIGGVLSLLWFRRRLPRYAAKFIEMVLMVTADHGPAVSGAHNTIVAARAGKDLISSLCSGLLTVGPRFGGALDAAATMFSEALDKGMSAKEFVNDMRRQSKLIMGIGHRVKSLHNPDMRVTIIKTFAKEYFPRTDTLDFALEVEQITTQKKANLILNVDGCIACAFVDLLRHCGAFTREEADEAIANGCLNGLFVLGRSIGFIGHYLDQKRLKQGLYRHPWDDISYIGDQMRPATPGL